MEAHHAAEYRQLSQTLYSELGRFTPQQVDVPSGASIFTLVRPALATTSPSPPLLLLHGYPQNHTCWSQLVLDLPLTQTLVIPDVPGYGLSTKTPSADHAAHSKRSLAKDMVDLMAALYGPETKFLVLGHDRGARIGYRAAMDFRNVVMGFVNMDTCPFLEQWGAMGLETHNHALVCLCAICQTYDNADTPYFRHWEHITGRVPICRNQLDLMEGRLFLAQPSPLPETMIGACPEFYMEYTSESLVQNFQVIIDALQ